MRNSLGQKLYPSPEETRRFLDSRRAAVSFCPFLPRSHLLVIAFFFGQSPLFWTFFPRTRKRDNERSSGVSMVVSLLRLLRFAGRIT